MVEANVNESSYIWTLPPAQVYYYWGITKTNIQMARWMDARLRAAGLHGFIYLAYDWHYPTDKQSLVPHLLALRGVKGNHSVSIRRLFFDESSGREDVYAPTGSQMPSQVGTIPVFAPSYTRPFAKRPGQWGVFHLLCIRAGEGTRPIPARLAQQMLDETR